MLFSSVAVALGQFFWKLAFGQINIWLVLGFMFYGAGAVSMVKALKHGSLSILHPIMAFSYIVAFFLSVYALKEPWNWRQVAGVLMIVCGITLLGRKGSRPND
jgi:drug/metabolite transporter (DMT)-like permease